MLAPLQFTMSSVNVILSLCAIFIIYLLIVDPLLFGAYQEIWTFESTIVVFGANGLSGTCAT